MKINTVKEALGAVATSNIPEGRFVLLTPHNVSYDFGSRTDLPGVKLPATADEAKRAKYVAAFAVDNREAPIIDFPSPDWGTRDLFGQGENAPFSATVYLTQPSLQDGQTIPSGYVMMALRGVITTSEFIDNAGLVPGAAVTVAYTGADAGKLQYASSMSDAVVGFVLEKYSGELTVELI